MFNGTPRARGLSLAALLAATGCTKSNTPPPQPPITDAPTDDAAAAEESADAANDEESADAKTTFTVAVWNLGWAHDAGDDGPKRAQEHRAKDEEAWDWKVKQIATILAKAKPDIVALTELGGNSEVGDIITAITEAKGPSYEWAFVESDDPHTGHQIAILSKFPIRDERRFDVHLRKLVVGDVTLPVQEGATDEITVVAIHGPEGKAARNATARAKQFEALLRPIKDLRKQHPVIVLGTFGSDIVPGDDGYEKSPVGMLAGLDTKAEDDDCDTSVGVGSAMRTNTAGLAFERIYTCGLTMVDAETLYEEEIFRQGADEDGKPWSQVPVDKEPHRDVSDSLLVMATVELPKPPPPPEPEKKAEGADEGAAAKADGS